jgi:glutaconate CoA-transferase subunit A
MQQEIFPMSITKDKVMSLKQAVAGLVTDGCHLSVGGFTVNRCPMAAVHEIIRQGRRGLHLYAHSNGQAVDELVGAGCVDRIEIAYGGSGRFAPTCVRFKKAVESGRLCVEDYTNYQMTLRFMAGAMGVPFLPTLTGLGTDIIARWGFSESMRRSDPRLPDRKLVVTDNPFGVWADATRVVLVPAATPDVTILHVQQADAQGTFRILGLSFADVEQAGAAKKVIVTCEELVDGRALRQDSDRNAMAFTAVDAVVHVPWGAFPTACWGRYDYDPDYLRMYAEHAADDARFEAWLDRFVRGVEDHEGFMDLVGRDRLERLRACGGRGYAPGLLRGEGTP